MDRLIAIVVLRFKTDMRGLLRSRGRALAAVVTTIALLLFSALLVLFVFGALRALDSARPEDTLGVVSLAFTGFGVVAALSPLMSGLVLAESHDVSRLMHYPVSSKTLAVASLLSNLVRPAVLTQLPVLLAAAAAVSASAPGTLIAFLGMGLSWLLVASGAHVAALLLHGLARHRRLHDILLVVGLVLGLAMSILPLVLIVQGATGGVPSLLSRLASNGLLALSPYSWGARAGILAARGEVSLGLAFLGLAAAAQLSAVALEAYLIERVHRGDLDLRGPSRRFLARMLLPGAWGALVEKDLRTTWRDPALRTVFVMGLGGPLVLLFFLLARGGSEASSYEILFVLAFFVGVSNFGTNGLGLERKGLGLLLSFPVERWRILVGKNLAMFLFRLPGLAVFLVCALAFAPIGGVPAAIVIASISILMCAAADNFMAILLPLPSPSAGQDPYAGARRGTGSGLIALAFLLGALALAAPFVFLAWLPALLGRLGLWAITLPLALFGALALYGMLVVGAGHLLERRESDLLERILWEP